MYITAADSTGGDAHQDLVRTRHRGGKIRDVELVVLRKKQSFHSWQGYMVGSRILKLTHVPWCYQAAGFSPKLSPP